MGTVKHSCFSLRACPCCTSRTWRWLSHFSRKVQNTTSASKACLVQPGSCQLIRAPSNLNPKGRCALLGSLCPIRKRCKCFWEGDVWVRDNRRREAQLYSRDNVCSSDRSSKRDQSCQRVWVQRVKVTFFPQLFAPQTGAERGSTRDFFVRNTNSLVENGCETRLVRKVHAVLFTQ